VRPIAVAGCLIAAVAISGCEEAGVGDPPASGGTASRASAAVVGSDGSASPQVAPPGASPGGGGVGSSGADGGHGNGGSAGSGRGVAHEVADPEEAKSFPLPASVHHRSASSPNVAAEVVVAQGARSDAEVRRELGEEERAIAQERAALRRVLQPVAGGFSVGGDGTIPIPTNVPEVVQRVIAGGNAIADFPYIWGGGHASFIANGYDCSGSVSYALAAGGLLTAPLVSGDLANWGEPGPGRWITIYATAGHTFMNVDGAWFDTAGRSGPYASRWLVSTPPLAGYAVRHPPGF
jgi:cell wall-associated NlpC family hydrolase